MRGAVRGRRHLHKQPRVFTWEILYSLLNLLLKVYLGRIFGTIV